MAKAHHLSFNDRIGDAEEFPKRLDEARTREIAFTCR
jgi:hypothetical protein